MDLIKFRAWNAAAKVMRYDFEISSATGQCKASNGDNLMQFIGLRDRNGIEVYDCDIVKFNTEYIGGKSGTGIVQWCDDFTVVSHPGWALWCPGWAYRMELLGCEVIGNVYEQPELIRE